MLTLRLDQRCRRWPYALLALGIAVACRADDAAWRLQAAVGAPDWLSLRGDYRLRYEYLDNTFRTVDAGRDDLLVSRLRLHVRATGQRFHAGAELQDARAWLAGESTPLGNDDVNALEPLQAYVGLRLAGVFRDGDRLDIDAGRLTLDVGSRRLVARNRFRNTSNAFTGVHASWAQAGGATLRGFLTMPVNRRPGSGDRLRDNDAALDQERLDQVFWGVHVAGVRLRDELDSEWYLYGLTEDDRPSLPTQNRELLTLGLRLMRSAAPWSFELEAAYQTGESRATTQAADVTDLDHRAWFVHFETRRRFAARWRPTLVLKYDYASGDEDPDDGRFGRFDTLFGARRFDFGHTGIYGLLARSNLSSPAVGVRLEISDDMTARFDYRAAWLASDRDALTAAGLRDPSGAAGSFVGHQLETRLRWSVIDAGLALEVGTAYLFKGEFLRNVPTAPPGSDTLYAYVTAELTF